MPRWQRQDRDGVVSYRLARQRTIAAVEAGHRTENDVCDAQPELRRVAHNHGKPLNEDCPLCESDDLVLVTFAFGPGLPKAGRCVTDRAEMTKLRRRSKPTTCYRIEVCQQCWWNHLRESFELPQAPVATTAT